MRVAVVGYGKMGREVEAVLRERGHEPVDRGRGQPASPPAARSASTSRGRTPWSPTSRARPGGGRPLRGGHHGLGRDQLAEVQRAGRRGTSGGLVHAANFSLGVNLFYRSCARRPRCWPASPTTTPTSSSATTGRRRTRPRARPSVLADILGGRRRARARSAVTELDGALARRPLPRRRGARGRHRGRAHGRLRLRRRRDPARAPRPHPPRLRLGAVLAAEWIAHPHRLPHLRRRPGRPRPRPSRRRSSLSAAAGPVPAPAPG